MSQKHGQAQRRICTDSYKLNGPINRVPASPRSYQRRMSPAKSPPSTGRSDTTRASLMLKERANLVFKQNLVTPIVKEQTFARKQRRHYPGLENYSAVLNNAPPVAPSRDSVLSMPIRHDRRNFFGLMTKSHLNDYFG